MAMLIPLLLPHVAEAAMNIGIGISNAVQGTSSNVTLQIGKKVFTTRKKFNFMDLSYELRLRIVLLALDMSQDLILPTPYLFNPIQPLNNSAFREMQKRHPLHPDNANYGSIMGDRVSANGYPISSWRWMKVSREWREMLQRILWEECVLEGYRPYRKFEKFMEDKKVEVLPMIKSITIREGFDSPSDIYSILSQPSLTALQDISILPDWPMPFHAMLEPVVPFPFGLQLVRTQKPIKSLTYGLPLEMTTNPSSRQQLRTLAVPRLNLSLARPTLAIFEELKELVEECTKVLGIRYVTTRITTEPELLLCEPLQAFDKVVVTLQLPRTSRVIHTAIGMYLEDDPNSATVGYVRKLLEALEGAEEEVQVKYEVYNVEGWDVQGEAKVRKRIWPVEEERAEGALIGSEEDGSAYSGEKGEVGEGTALASASTSAEPRRSIEKKSQWERQTNLKLLGGLIGLSLESKRY